MRRCSYLEDDMSEIKISSLSVGDWVLFAGLPRRVAIISSTCVLPHKGVFDIATFSIDDISPIPITPEILEKNGFVGEIDGDNPVRTEFVFKPVNIVGFADCDFYHCRIWHPKGYGRILFPKIHYVHELQHILRLAGVEKEIDEQDYQCPLVGCIPRRHCRMLGVVVGERKN